MKDIFETVKSLEDSGLLLKGVSETIQNEGKEQKGGFLSMLFGALGASVLVNILAGKRNKKTWRRSDSEETRSRNCKSWLWKQKSLKNNNKKQKEFLMLPHPLTNFEIEKYNQNQTRFNGVYSRDNLPKIKDGAYVINLEEYSNIGTYLIALYVLNNDATYFDSFAVEHIPQEIKTFIDNKNIKTDIFRTQAHDSIMCGYFCIGFIDFMLAGKTLTDFTNLFSPNNF